MVTTQERIPVVLTGHALRSLRDSGYTLPAAVGEVIDNSLEANANTIRVILDDDEDGRGRRRIHRIIFVDDGDGMDQETLFHYLQIGFSTRYMSTTTIGKYGVGAKLAALNFAQRIDVWSRAEETAPWLSVSFDLQEAIAEEERGGSVGIDAPEARAVPDELAGYLPAGRGTLVVWSNVDRLEEGRWASDVTAMRTDVEKELSRMFRRFLNGGITIIVGDRTSERALLPHDPLFLMEGSWADKTLHTYYSGKEGKQLAEALGFEWDSVPTHFPADVIADDRDVQVPGTKSKIRLRVTLYPREVIRKKLMGGDNLSKKLRVPDNEGAISFVRLDREINYTNVPRIFPRGVEDADRFIGIEVSFTPDLDEYFGVRNVKRGVEPHSELRDAIRALLQKYVREAREKLDDIWGGVTRDTREHEGEHVDIAAAAAEANRTLPKGRAKGPESEEEAKKILDDLARDVGRTEEDEKREYIDKIRELPFVVESVDFPGTNFIDIQHLSHQIIIRLNVRHPFYREMWEPIRELAEATPGTISGSEANKVARRTIEALTLLVIAYGKAESMHESPRDQYGDLRSYWGQFLNSLLGKVKGVV